jgi:hypothetical protein
MILNPSQQIENAFCILMQSIVLGAQELPPPSSSAWGKKLEAPTLHDGRNWSGTWVLILASTMP